MGIAVQRFEGIETNIPGIYSKSEFPAQNGMAGAASDIVVVLGEAESGIPIGATGVDSADKLQEVTSVPDALNLLQGGAAYFMTEFYLTPTKDDTLQKPSKVYVGVVNDLTYSEAVLEASAVEIIELQSGRYGTIANQLCRKVEAGTTVGKKITVKFKGEKIAEVDDIYYAYMIIQYTGGGSAATMTINGTTLSTTCTGAATDDLSITLANYSKLSELVDYINSQPNYTCTIAGRGDADSATFDAVTAQDIKTSAYTATAVVQAIIDFFNNECGGEIVAALKSGAARTIPDNDSNFVYFTGGTKSAADSSDWSAAFTLLENFSINHILIATGEATYHDMLLTHLNQMSNIENAKNRSGAAGAGDSVTNDTQMSEARQLGGARIEYWGTPFKRRNKISGEIESFEPFYLAAMGAGIRFGGHITNYTDFKDFNIAAVERTYTTPEKKKLIDAGVSLVGEVNNAFEVISNTSCYGQANLILNLPSMLRTTDFITLDSQVKLKAYLKNIKQAPTAFVVKSVESYILNKMLPGYVDEGYLTEDFNSGTPAFTDIEFTLSGDRFDFKFTGIVPAPLRFGFIKQKFVVPGFLD